MISFHRQAYGIALSFHSRISLPIYVPYVLLCFQHELFYIELMQLVYQKSWGS